MVAIALSLAGCAEGIDDDDEASFRCAGGLAAGLIGLDSVDISGNPSIYGAYPNVFSNGNIGLSGSFDVDGTVVAGGTVTISGNGTPAGGYLEDATPIEVADPTADVVYAKTHNANSTIPCVKKGNKCTSVVSNYELSLSSQQVLKLKAGTYYLEGISVSGQAKIDIEGTVVIYLAGGASFNGGAATNPSTDSLTIISSSSSEIKLNGGGDTKVDVYAPFATVRFSGNQAYHGSALGKTVKVSGTADLEITKDLAVTAGYVTCLPEPDPDPEPEPDPDPTTTDDGGDDGDVDAGDELPDDPTDGMPPQPPN